MKKGKAGDLALLTGEGMAVFPLAGNTRIPLKDSSGFKDATTDIKEAKAMFEDHPTANIGVATGPASGVVVVDVDVKKGKPGDASLAKIEKRVGKLTNTTLVRTTTGGRHLWFEYPDKDLRCTESKLALGLDVRADGGYVVAPHSTINGKKYEWVNGLLRIKPMPDDLHELMLKSQGGKAAQTVDDESDAEKDTDKKASDPALCRAALHAIKQKIKDWDDYDDCIDVCGAIKGALEEPGRKDWHGWAAQCDEYTEAWADAKWDSFKKPYRSGAGSIFYWAEKSGWVRPSQTFRTEVGLSERFILDHQANVRYDEAENCWYAWDGTLWVPQSKKAGKVQELVKRTARAIVKAAVDLPKESKEEEEERKKALAWGFQAEKKQSLRNAMDLAASDPQLQISMDKLDQDPYLLGTQNGILNLRKGKLVKAAREHYVTRSVAVEFDPKANCPRWEQFISEVMMDEPIMIHFIQRLVGYLLIGGNPLRLIFFLYGIGRNGKSVFIETLLKLFGDYGEPAKSALLMTHRMERDAESAQPFMLKLRGKRYITASEVGEGMVLDAGLVKTLTGGDEMSCRGNYLAPVKFTVEGKFVIRCNNRPVIDGADQAMWDRVVEIPFNLRLEENEQDTTLRDTLTAELPGILNWALLGCRRYQKNGMLSKKAMLPKKVRWQTARYRDSQDTVATWLNDYTIADKNAKTRSSLLYTTYKTWCDECSRPGGFTIRPESQQKFNKALTARGYNKKESNSVTRWLGVKLVKEPQS